MPPEMTTRPVPAPAKDWLTEDEVLELIGNVSDRTLDRMIGTGQFPPGRRWPNGKRRWPWRAVAWFLLGMELGVSPSPPGDDDPDPPAGEPRRPARAAEGTARSARERGGEV